MRLAGSLLLGLALGLGACAEESTPATSPSSQLVENHPNSLVVSEPKRAAFLEATPNDDIVVIKGTGATKALTVQGQSADVAADGSFTAKIHATPGLNLIVASDGPSRLETSFLYGHFVQPTTPIANAVALSIGNRAINGPLPDASLETVINLALQNRDLLGMAEGQSFHGDDYGVSWNFEILKASNGPAKVIFNSAEKGIGIDASIQDLAVEGRLSMTSKAIDYTRGVKISITKGGIRGDLELAVDGGKGAITAAMPNANATVEGFKFDTDNAGFPCCVDSILTNIIQGKVADALNKTIKNKVPEAVQLTLDGMGVPRKINFSAAGFNLNMPVSTKFDGGFFDRDGATITAATMFGGDPDPKYPGWLALGAPYAGAVSRSPGVSVSVSLDALNQLMYAVWANGSLQYDAPAPLAAHLALAMPPVISITPEGAVRVGVGEILVKRQGSANALASVSVQQDVTAEGKGRSLVLTPKGKPTVSVTWLADDSAGSGLNLVGQAAEDQVTKLLKPFAFPLPAFAMDALGGALMGNALVIDSPAITVDAKQQRIEASGLMQLIK